MHFVFNKILLQNTSIIFGLIFYIQNKTVKHTGGKENELLQVCKNKCNVEIL